MLKQTSSFQRWKRRFFKLRGRTLYYAKDSKVRRTARYGRAASLCPGALGILESTHFGLSPRLNIFPALPCAEIPRSVQQEQGWEGGREGTKMAMWNGHHRSFEICTKQPQDSLESPVVNKGIYGGSAHFLDLIPSQDVLCEVKGKLLEQGEGLSTVGLQNSGVQATSPFPPPCSSSH